MATEFGLIVVALDSTIEDAKAIAASIDPDSISVPLGKPSFEGPVNGIRLYNTLDADNRSEGCRYSAYGIENSQFQGVVPEDSPLAIRPTYLPEGFSEGQTIAHDCGGGLELVEASFRGGGLGVIRASGERAWYSVYSEDWITAVTIAGLPAVVIASPEWAKEEERPTVVVREAFGITVVYGSASLEDAIRVVEGLNR